ncbi:hypothetical protein Pta02_12570 [Planobispora takensis]|uniref:Uncharacterized protein n=1 Tax=Planobispora takensis TaxID=1367882 RepID=A0A8J3SRG3_9ACTN|nr:hypothetical protein Pta02_12570 [Planobispora takensis]
MVDVVFRGPVPPDARPFAASPQEVAGPVRLTVAEAETDPRCPPWVPDSLRRAASI